jgi:hypothetical protein
MALDPRTAEAVLLGLYVETERELQDRGAMPRPQPGRLQRSRRALEIAGAVNLGFLIACLTIFVLFVFLNLVFHVQYFPL